MNVIRYIKTSSVQRLSLWDGFSICDPMGIFFLSGVVLVLMNLEPDKAQANQFGFNT